MRRLNVNFPACWSGGGGGVIGGKWFSALISTSMNEKYLQSKEMFYYLFIAFIYCSLDGSNSVTVCFFVIPFFSLHRFNFHSLNVPCNIPESVLIHAQNSFFCCTQQNLSGNFFCMHNYSSAVRARKKYVANKHARCKSPSKSHWAIIWWSQSEFTMWLLLILPVRADSIFHFRNK